jgi:mRNA interferase RelE/StbE
MTYELAFLDIALSEWRKLDGSVRDQFKKKLAERLAHPRVPSVRLSRAADRYKIKLRSLGYRLAYEVRDDQRVVVVVAVGKREREAVCRPRQSGRGVSTIKIARLAACTR